MKSWLSGARHICELIKKSYSQPRCHCYFANISPLMDLAFGTYTCPDYEPEKFGIREEFPQHYLGQMLDPVLPGFVKRRWKKKELPTHIQEALDVVETQY